MMGWGYGMMGSWFGMIIPLSILAILGYAVVRLLGHSNTTSRSVRGHDNSINILNERFARGEITEEEYKHKKELIMKR